MLADKNAREAVYMKKLRFLGIIFIVAAITSFISCLLEDLTGSAGGDTFVPVTGITGVPATGTVDTVLTLTGTVTPNNATYKRIVWSVKDAGTTEGKVDDYEDKVKATAEGTLVLTATIKNGKAQGAAYKKDFYIVFSNKFVPVARITGVPTTGTVRIPLTLTGTVEPDTATNQAITWSVTDPGRTGIKPGLVTGDTVTATAPGTLTVTATIVNGYTTTTKFMKNFDIEFPFVSVTDITGVPTMGMVRTPLTLTGTVEPGTATNQTITWSVNIADSTATGTVSGNIVTATAPGTLKVTATIVYTATTKFMKDFDISFPFEPVTDITGVPTTGTVNTPLTLNGTIAPDTATYQTIVWSVRNAGTTGITDIGTGNNVTAKMEGSLIVTATIANGTAQGTAFTRDFPITFSIKPVTNITGIPTTGTIGTELTLNGTVVPSTASNKNIAWSVKTSGAGITAIGADNKVKATAAGTLTITATIANGTAQGTAYTEDFTITFGFMPVSGITVVNTEGTVNIPFILIGMVEPSNATNKDIVWEVRNAGTTGIKIHTKIKNGDPVTATAPGTLVVAGTVKNGTVYGDYTIDFKITFSIMPVSGITVDNTARTVGIPFTLTGTVAPTNATNQDIVWSVRNAGTTGITDIEEGNTVTAKTAGTLTVTATIENGTAPGTAYTEDFSIVFEEPTAVVPGSSKSKR